MRVVKTCPRTLDWLITGLYIFERDIRDVEEVSPANQFLFQ